MKSATFTLFLLIVLSSTLCGQAVAGMEFKLFGVIQKIESELPDGLSATVTIKETRSDKIIVITVTDTLTLDKLRDRRIVTGDDIRCTYKPVGGRNISRVFKKSAGC